MIEYKTGADYGSPSDPKPQVLNIWFVERSNDPFASDAWDTHLVFMEDPVRGLEYSYAILRSNCNPAQIGAQVNRAYLTNSHIPTNGRSVGDLINKA